MRLEASILVAADPETVWRIVTDPALGPRWNPNVLSVTDISGTPVRTGTTWTQSIRVLGHPVEMRGEVTECEPPFRGVVRFTGPGQPAVTTIVEPDGDGVRLKQIMEITIPPGLSGVGLRLGAPLIEQQLREALRRQKEAVEAEASGGAGNAEAV